MPSIKTHPSTRPYHRVIAGAAATALAAITLTACGSNGASAGDSSSGSASTGSGSASASASGSTSASASGSQGSASGSSASGSEGSSGKLDTSDPFVLGVGLPLTGDQAQYGIGSKAADVAAASYVNAHGGMNGHKLVLQFWDTVAQPATGVAGTHKFISSHVNAVSGYFNSDVTIPAVRLLEKAGIPLFGDNPSSPQFASMNLTNFTRITGDDKNEGLVQADFVWSKLHLKTAVAIDDNESFGQAFTQAFSDEYTKLGGKVVKHFSADASVTDYGSLISQIKQLNPDVIEYSGFNPGAALLLKQARAAGVKAVYVTDSSQYGSDFSKIAGKAAVGSYLTNNATTTNSSNPLFKYMSDALKPQKIEATGVFADAFDSVLDAWHAATTAKSNDPADLIKVMHSVTFDGATGHVSFLKNGDRAQVKYNVLKIKPNLEYAVAYNYDKTLT